MRRYRGPRRVIFIGIYASASRARLSCALCARAHWNCLPRRRYCHTRILDFHTLVPRRWEEFIVVYRRLALRIAPILSATFRVARREGEKGGKGEWERCIVATPAVNIIYSSPPHAVLVNLVHQSRTTWIYFCTEPSRDPCYSRFRFAWYILAPSIS